MAIIGTFTKDGENFVGSIVTLALKAKATIQSVVKATDSAPDYRVFSGGVEIGAAWSRKSQQGERPYLSVKLDDPSFGGAIFCRLVYGAEGGHHLMWSR